MTESGNLTIFDCDGVLVDSEIIAAEVVAGLLATLGYRARPAEIAERFSGTTTAEIFRVASEETGRPVPDGLVDRAESETARRLRREARAVEGAKEMLDAVPGPRCVCSNSEPERVEASLRAAGLFGRLDGRIFSAREIPGGRGKPEPDIFLYAAERLGAEPLRVLVVEDSVAGVEGACRAGMRAVGFTGGAHTYPGHADRLTDAGAITVVNRLAEVPATLLALRHWNPEAI